MPDVDDENSIDAGAVNTSEAPGARLHLTVFVEDGFTTETAEAPVARTRCARCGPRRSRCSLLQSLRRASSPSRLPLRVPPHTATAPHASPASSLAVFASLDRRRLPRAVLLAVAEGDRSEARATALSSADQSLRHLY
ncbi:hypothetical protein BN903_100 [Halorubrum sp. AJ67]|nr:hypothetical protein BN903_100 [Halorubrum sp. AJ67]